LPRTASPDGHSPRAQQADAQTVLREAFVTYLSHLAPFRTVRTLRDLLADGAHVTDGAFQTAQHTYYKAVRATASA
jgi:hypothetical protein